MNVKTRAAWLAILLTAGGANQLALSSEVSAASSNTTDDAGYYGEGFGYGRGRNLGIPGVLADLILLRPFGVAMTVGGVALFGATSPFTGIASIAPPHDAFNQAYNAFVVGPAGFTFSRPLGEMSYQRSGVYPILTKPADRKIEAPVPIATKEMARSPAAVTPATQTPKYVYPPGQLEYPIEADDRNPGN
jgi:cell division septation protein DedD